MKGAQTIEFNKEKFKELVLYVAERSANDPYFGATKLNKILFFSDFFAYGNLGTPITGATYQVLRHGPAPKKLLPVRAEMMREGTLAMRRERMLRFVQKRPIALRQPDESQFSAAELAVVDEVITALRGRSAFEVSQVSHDMVVAWQLAPLGEEIPYETVFLSSRKPSPRHIARAQEIASDLGRPQVAA